MYIAHLKNTGSQNCVTGGQIAPGSHLFPGLDLDWNDFQLHLLQNTYIHHFLLKTFKLKCMLIT